MCEFSERLIAWLDGELPEGEAAKMERHLGECSAMPGAAWMRIGKRAMRSRRTATHARDAARFC